MNAACFDHTILKPDTTEPMVKKLCQEAIEYGFFSACVNGVWVPLVNDQLAGTSVKTCSVVGFPLGANSVRVKIEEAKDLVRNKIDEIDMVLAVGALKEKRHSYVLEDIGSVVKAAEGRIVKVIIEAGLLSDEEKMTACKLIQEAGAHFVKTSTGFGFGGGKRSGCKTASKNGWK